MNHFKVLSCASLAAIGTDTGAGVAILVGPGGVTLSLSCPKQDQCPGCPLGAEPYAAGLARKGRELALALEPYGGLRPALLRPRAASPTLEYRLRAKLVSHGRALGLFERGSHRVVDVEGCRVLSKALTRASAAVRRMLPLPIHGADLRETSEGVLVTLLSEHEAARPLLEAAGRALVDRGEALSVALSVRREGGVRLLSGEPELLAGPGAARHALSSRAPYAYAAHGGFVQAHAGQAGYVHSEIARGLQQRLGGLPGAQVLELFAGNGSLALALAAAGAEVTAVEVYRPALALAERAAREQGLSLTAISSDAARFVQGDSGRRFDAIVVNPPRRGLDASLRRAIGHIQPRALVYVSCNPHTFARDAAHLRLQGCNLECAEPLDMIPWSDAIEALGWFESAPPPAPPVLFEDAECLAVSKGAHEPLAAANGPCLAQRVRGLPGCGNAVALEAWGPGVSGACWFSKDPGSAERLREALRTEQRVLSVVVRGELRKQGRITRRTPHDATAGSRYRKQANAGRHSLVWVFSHDLDESGVLRDFASIRHPVLGDATHCDPPSNQFAQHRLELDRPFLHISRSGLSRPGGARHEVQAELAPDLSRVLTCLGSN